MKKDLTQENLLKLEQRLSPEQVLILKILQTPKVELLENICNEIEQNPSLLIDSEEIEEIEETELEDVDFEKELKDIVKEDFLTYFEPIKEEDKFLEIPAPKPSFKEFLKQELAFHTSDEEVLNIGEYIIESLNEHGFLESAPEELAKDLNVELNIILKAIKILNEIEPGGYGLKGTKEYLLYQIRKFCNDEICEGIIRDHYNEFLKNDYYGLAKKLKLDLEEVKKRFEKIKTLRPFPASFEFGEIEYIVPDVYVEIENNELKISINETELPYLYINPDHLEILKNEKNYDKETVKFIKEKVKRGLLFIKGLEMRRKIFRKLIEFILNEQKDFILKGEEFKKPLRLKDVAEKLNLNLATSSRILKDVYVQVYSKIYNIKQFFSLPSKTKGDLSRDNIKMIIKKIIQEEKTPLKDTEITKKLLMMGIKINKRTVTKYREELNILPYNIRRRLNKEEKW